MSDDESPLIEVRNYAMAIALRATRGDRDLSEDIASDVMLEIECPPELKKQPPRPFLLSQSMCKRWLRWRVLDRIKNKIYREHRSLSDYEETAPKFNTHQGGWSVRREIEDSGNLIGAVHIARKGVMGRSRGDDA